MAASAFGADSKLPTIFAGVSGRAVLGSFRLIGLLEVGHARRPVQLAWRLYMRKREASGAAVTIHVPRMAAPSGGDVPSFKEKADRLDGKVLQSTGPCGARNADCEREKTSRRLPTWQSRHRQ
jgi:hypothetical protein